MLIQVGQIAVALITSLLGLFVLRSRYASGVHRAFATQCLLFAGWGLGLSGLHRADTIAMSFALAFGFASLIPIGVLIFHYAYSRPTSSPLTMPTYFRWIFAVGCLFAML